VSVLNVQLNNFHKTQSVLSAQPAFSQIQEQLNVLLALKAAPLALMLTLV